MTSDAGTAPPPPAAGEAATFDAFSRAVQARFDAVVAADGHLFEVDAPDLGPLFLEHLPAERRPYHTCSCCLTFLRRFGRLVTVTKNGGIASALWSPDTVPDLYRPAVTAMMGAVTGAPIRSAFLASGETWGRPTAGGFPHFSLAVPETRRYGGIVVTARQAMAARREDFRTLSHALDVFDRRVVAQALTLLRAEALYRSEKVIGPAEFLLRLHDEVPRKAGPKRDAILWRAVANAPPGFCTPRGGMIGTLLADIAEGRDFATVKARFAAKMHPLAYQRPQAAPRAGTIAQAERLFAQLGLEPALRRRYARLDEIPTIWRPRHGAAPAEATASHTASGIFGGLKARQAAVPEAVLDMPAQTVTWSKFARDVLPDAQRMWVFTAERMTFCGLVTAVDPEAPPLLQWDRPEARNPVSWYIYVNGSTPTRWRLPEGAWVPVTGATLLPVLWSGADRYRHHRTGAVLILDGAQDDAASGLCLFPEFLRSDLHGVRAVIEAYSKAHRIEGVEEGTANGLLVGQDGDHRIRVESAIGTATYRIDRWE